MAGLLAIPTPMSGAAPPCKATNVTQGTKDKLDLQAAIDSANPDDTIQVKGVCAGPFTVGKNLSLVGKNNVSKAQLNGGGSSVLTVASGVNVTLTNLLVTGTILPFGVNFGIYNAGGTVTLNDSSSVSGIHAPGIFNAGGTVTLNDSSSVSGNAGGIYNAGGTVTLNDSSSVSGNSAVEGGGISNFGGTVTLNDSSSVSDNRAIFEGGGIDNEGGTVTLNDSSSMSDNSGSAGGGIWNNAGTVTLNDSSSVSGNRAFYKADGGGGGGILRIPAAR